MPDQEEERRPRIYTHQNMDLDSVFGVWAAVRFLLNGRPYDLHLVPASWNDEIKPGDYAVDIDAGGRGYKGKVDGDGTVHSCFSLIVQRHAGFQDQIILKPLVDFVDVADSRLDALNHLTPGANAQQYRALWAGSIHAVIGGLKQLYIRYGTARFEQETNKLITGIYWYLQEIHNKIPEIRRAFEKDVEWHFDRRIAVVHSSIPGVNGKAFRKGALTVIYDSGNEMGILRNRVIDDLSMYHPVIAKVVDRVGELPKWFKHPSGRLFCHGTRKSPCKTKSRVHTTDLVAAAAEVLKEHGLPW